MTMGNVTVNEERTQLTITNFASDLGLAPLELYLIADAAFLTSPESRNIGQDDFITLGVIQAQSGEMFTYDLPEDIDFETFQYLSAWCVPARVNFGHAFLE